MAANDTQLEVAAALKNAGPSTVEEVSTAIGVSYETVRAQIARMAERNLVESSMERSNAAGRPAKQWRLTANGEHLFPKAYDALATELLSVLADELPQAKLDAVLQAVVEQKLANWMPALEGAGIEERLDAMRSIYTEGDPYVSVERDDRGLRLVERNCPFLDVATHHPVLCNITVNTLSRVLNRRVVREEKFQDGAGRCVFQVTDEPPPDGGFEREDR